MEAGEGVTGFTEGPAGAIGGKWSVFGEVLEVREDTVGASDVELEDVNGLTHEGGVF